MLTLFSYKPEVIDIDTELKPFIPDFIPAVGEVDAFLKIPRPDGEVEKLGLATIDEPKLNQSKRAVLDLMLAEHGKVHRKDYKEVHSVSNAHKNPREITNWVKNVEKIIDVRAAPTVAYSQKMPDIDDLMQVSYPLNPFKILTCSRLGTHNSKLQSKTSKFQKKDSIFQLRKWLSTAVLYWTFLSMLPIQIEIWSSHSM